MTFALEVLANAGRLAAYGFLGIMFLFTAFGCVVVALALWEFTAAGLRRRKALVLAPPVSAPTYEPPVQWTPEAAEADETLDLLQELTDMGESILRHEYRHLGRVYLRPSERKRKGAK